MRNNACPITTGSVWKWIEIAATYLIFSAVAFGADAVTLNGKVTDAAGKPIEHATVMVYHAGVKTGYSTFCPSCYADCGKRTFTDATGTYTFTHLNPDLWFELLVVRAGYGPVSIMKVDPSTGPATAVLSPRSSSEDPRQMVRGRVVDRSGNLLRDVVVQPQGIASSLGAMIGTVPGLDLLVVTDDKGEFEIHSEGAASKMLILVEARNMAPKFIVMDTGTERRTVSLYEGAIIRGRLIADGKAVGGAEIGLVPRDRGGFGSDLSIFGNPYGELKVGTQDDGSFAITNVPAPVEWCAYAKMKSLVGRGATEPVMCATSVDGQVVDVGDIEVKPGHRLKGQIVLSDGKPIANGMEVVITSDRGWDSQTVTLGPDGHFEFEGLSTGNYSISPAVRGYTLPGAADNVAVSIDHDLDSRRIVLTPVGSTPTQH
jgi:Carboxypeptidase regulatory-like domain